jgi:hypothetical protein
MDALDDTDDLQARRRILTEANRVLSMARAMWQDEMKMLRSGIESLRDARAQTMRLAVRKHDVVMMSQLGFEENNMAVRD